MPLSVMSSIMDFIADNVVDTSNIVAVGCDGTVINTWQTGGVIRLMEQKLEKPLQWLICQLHANELPLRHLLQHLDGRTARPHGFSGPIDKSLEECEKLPVVEFDKIEADMPASEMTDLSTDHKYLEEMCKLLQLVIAPWICPEEIQVDLRIRDGLQLQTESYVGTLELGFLVLSTFAYPGIPG